MPEHFLQMKIISIKLADTNSDIVARALVSVPAASGTSSLPVDRGSQTSQSQLLSPATEVCAVGGM
jgi:hypothetical protein